MMSKTQFEQNWKMRRDCVLTQQTHKAQEQLSVLDKLRCLKNKPHGFWWRIGQAWKLLADQIEMRLLNKNLTPRITMRLEKIRGRPLIENLTLRVTKHSLHKPSKVWAFNLPLPLLPPLPLLRLPLLFLLPLPLPLPLRLLLLQRGLQSVNRSPS